MLVMGVDAGGTSTRAVLATADGECIGFGRGGSGNPTSSGIPTALAGVRGAISGALDGTGARLADVAGIVIAMAGHDARGGASDWIMDPLAQDGFVGTLTFESDLLAMYSSGAVAPVGYGVVCGTGASAVRVEGGRIVATADGLGWLLGDRGSGFWIGRGAAAAAVDELEGIGPSTALTSLVLQATGAVGEGRSAEGRPAALERLVRVLYTRRPVQLAEFAPLVFDAADAQDPVALRILTDAGEHLVRTLALVSARPGPVVAGGSIVSRDGAPQRLLREHLATAFGDQPFVLVDSGAAGATMLALRHAGVAVDEGTLARVRAGIPV
ncbi:BadF-type ATPase [Microbacterium azadirachtae]|uniref:BadF-type ATPase n=1 Tax=Microbacterium azadirachtae TaxID=582680 RepID=A0A1I6GG90_9MICO|nr:BadF/BadG/BcrA/BcrD ATPase family protein [Microbacterium azadirachtae]SFR41150.1 BadF-type ATPase [Microbacterium azadirachtae]